MLRPATVLLLLLFASCSPVVHSTSLSARHTPRPAESPVLTYSVRAPECAYEEIALLTVERGPPFSREQPLDAREKRARQLGGDAIVGLTQLPPSEEFRGGLSGTVVRFVNESCRE